MAEWIRIWPIESLQQLHAGRYLCGDLQIIAACFDDSAVANKINGMTSFKLDSRSFDETTSAEVSRIVLHVLSNVWHRPL